MTNLIDDNEVFLDVDIASKEDLFDFVAQRAVELGVSADAAAVAADLMEREGQMTTGLTDGFAIPHTKSTNVDKVGVLFVRTTSAVAWETMDDVDPTCFFVLLVPHENEGNIHLQMISQLATCLLEDDFKQRVRAAKDAGELVGYVADALATQ